MRFLLLLIPFISIAQGKASRMKFTEADHAFKNSQFRAASISFEKILDKDPKDRYAHYYAAECYRYLYEYENAEEHYAELLVEEKDDYPLARYYYALMLKAQNNLDDARQEFEEFIREYDTPDIESEQFKRSAELELASCKSPVPPLPSSVIYAQVSSFPFASSFSLVPSDSSILISQPQHWLQERKMFQTQYLSTIPTNQQHPFPIKVSSEYTPLDYFLSADRKKVYFTAQVQANPMDPNSNLLDVIFVSRLDPATQKWSKAERLNSNINEAKSDNGQPFLSEDGKRIFFVSDRSGGRGQTDIWYSESNGDDNWSEAINLEINTVLSEVTPSFYTIDSVGYLFFSSNGNEIGNTGGLDVYMATDTANYTWHRPLRKVNTTGDNYNFRLGTSNAFLISDKNVLKVEMEERKSFIFRVQ